MLSGSDQAVPIGLDVVGRTADLGDDGGDQFRRYHFDGVPGADGQFVGIGLLLGNMHANFATDASFDVDLAPGLVSLDAVLHLFKRNTIDRTDFQARLATRAVVGIYDGNFFGKFLAGSLFGHRSVTFR